MLLQAFVLVGARSDATALARPVRVHESARLLQQFVRVRAEVVALGLDQVGGQNGRSVAVVEGESGAEGGRRDAELDCRSDHRAPAVLQTNAQSKNKEGLALTTA